MARATATHIEFIFDTDHGPENEGWYARVSLPPGRGSTSPEFPVYSDPPIRRTAEVVKFLMSRRDQVASTEEVADGILCATATAREALRLLQRKGRVDEIHPDLWHLE